MWIATTAEVSHVVMIMKSESYCTSYWQKPMEFFCYVDCMLLEFLHFVLAPAKFWYPFLLSVHYRFSKMVCTIWLTILLYALLTYSGFVDRISSFQKRSDAANISLLFDMQQGSDEPGSFAGLGYRLTPPTNAPETGHEGYYAIVSCPAVSGKSNTCSRNSWFRLIVHTNTCLEASAGLISTVDELANSWYFFKIFAVSLS